MAKTYNTIGTFTSGQVLTAAQMNEIGTNVNNYRVPPMCMARLTNTPTLTTGTSTFITWNSESYDTDGMFSASSESITAQTNGIYLASASLTFASNATGARLISIMKNPTNTGDHTKGFVGSWGQAANGTETVLNASAPVSLVAGDVIKVVAFQSSGGNLNCGAIATWTGQSGFSLTWMGQAS